MLRQIDRVVQQHLNKHFSFGPDNEMLSCLNTYPIRDVLATQSLLPGSVLSFVSGRIRSFFIYLITYLFEGVKKKNPTEELGQEVSRFMFKWITGTVNNEQGKLYVLVAEVAKELSAFKKKKSHWHYYSHLFKWLSVFLKKAKVFFINAPKFGFSSPHRWVNFFFFFFLLTARFSASLLLCRDGTGSRNSRDFLAQEETEGGRDQSEAVHFHSQTRSTSHGAGSDTHPRASLQTPVYMHACTESHCCYAHLQHARLSALRAQACTATVGRCLSWGESFHSECERRPDLVMTDSTVGGVGRFFRSLSRRPNVCCCCFFFTCTNRI